jgi:L,D-transpeptidase catalytic domain
MNRTHQTHHRIPKLLAVLAFASLNALADEKRADPRRIVVSIPDHKLALLEGDRVLRVYDIAVGKVSTPSPEGAFRVVTRIAHPTYYHAGKVVGPGKSNPLGTRWLGLSVAGYGIHGTNVPQSIGQHASQPRCRRAVRTGPGWRNRRAARGAPRTVPQDSSCCRLKLFPNKGERQCCS